MRALRVAGNDGGQSAAADCDDDFEGVAIGEHFLDMAATRHDFAVALYGYALAREIKVLDEFAAVERPVESMGYAVDG